MKTFKVLVEDYDYNDYQKAISILEGNNNINENILLGISNNIKKKIKFIKEISLISKTKIEELLILFKNKEVYKFFKLIKFSFKYFYNLLKKGYEVYSELESVISSYITSNKNIKWTKKQLAKLDKYLESHPKLKKVSGLVVAGLLLYIWLNMSFTPSLDYSMDFSDIFNSLQGNFSISDLFASDSGVQMLLYLATGSLLGLSFPWPGSQSSQMVIATINALRKMV